MKSFLSLDGGWGGKRRRIFPVIKYRQCTMAMDATNIYQSYSAKNSGINQMKRLLLLKFFGWRKPWPCTEIDRFFFFFFAQLNETKWNGDWCTGATVAARHIEFWLKIANFIRKIELLRCDWFFCSSYSILISNRWLVIAILETNSSLIPNFKTLNLNIFS